MVSATLRVGSTSVVVSGFLAASPLARFWKSRK